VDDRKLSNRRIFYFNVFSSCRHSADIRLPSNDDKTGMTNQPIPNLLVTHESIPNLPNNNNNNNLAHVTYHLSPFKYDTTCQRIKDWITTTTSSTALNDNNDNLAIQTRCASAINITENTPMLIANKQYPQNFPPLTNLKRHFPRIEQLYGPTSAPNSFLHPHQQVLLADDHVASVQNFAVMQRSSVCSLTSSMLTGHLLRNNRPSTSSSMGSTSQQGIRKRPPRLHDGLSQASFQMVSLDTDDTSSCSSSLTHHSANLQSAKAGMSSSKSHKKRQKFRNLTKSSASNERKAMRVLLIIFSIFVILWTPFFIINLLSCFISDIHPILMSIATWLGYCSSCANPIIYTIFSRAFRQAFINIITCQKVIRSQISRPSCHSMPMSARRKSSSLSKGHIDGR
jgi:hypothetical protein